MENEGEMQFLQAITVNTYGTHQMTPPPTALLVLVLILILMGTDPYSHGCFFVRKTHHVHEVATLLKMFFRELPDPVVPTTHYHSMLDASLKSPPEFLETARRCVGEFPTINAT